MLSIVICNRDPKKWSTVNAMYKGLLGDMEHEIIGIHDASGICEGYNRGIERARGDLLAFSHDDVEFLDRSFAPRLTKHLLNCDLIGIAGASKCVGGNWGDAKHPYLLGQISQVAKNGFPVLFFGVHHVPRIAQVLDGVFLACRRQVVERLKFDQTRFPGWHGYDSDFSFSAHGAGFRVAAVSDLFAVHHSWGNQNEQWRSAMASFMEKHRMPVLAPRNGTHGGVLAADRQEVVHLMSEALRLSADPYVPIQA